MRVGDHHVHQPVGRYRCIPRECLVDPRRAPVGIHEEIFRTAREAEMRTRQRAVRPEMLRPSMRGRVCLDRLRIRRLEAKTAWAIHRADQHLQEVDGARGLEPV